MSDASRPAGTPRKRLLAAAAELFAAHSYSSVSTAQIAAAAAASKETLYSQFGGKAQLLRAVLEELVTAPQPPDSGAAVQAALSPAQFHTLVRDFAVELVGNLTQPTYLALARIVVAETPRDPSLAESFREAVAERALVRAATLLEGGQQAGVVDVDIDPAIAARALIGPLLTYVLLDGLLRTPDDVRPPSRRTVTAHVDLFVRSVRNTKTSEDLP